MILLIGGTGYVGLKFQEILSSRNIEFKNLSRSEVDYYDFKTLNDVIANAKPQFVLNAGGFTGKPNVDQCEINKSGTIMVTPQHLKNENIYKENFFTELSSFIIWNSKC